MPNFRPVTQALFDLDGLLLDTESIYTRVTQRIVAPFGKTFDWSIKANMIGRDSRDSSKYLVEALDLPMTGDEYLVLRDKHLREAFPAADALPGARRLIEHLKDNDVPIAVATSSSRELFDIKTSRHQDWFALFDHVVTSDDPEVERAKPAPDIFLTAARRLGGAAETSLVFEDAPSGLEAGTTAGMQVVAVPDPNMDKSLYGDAAVVLDSLTEFRPELFGIAAYPD